MLRRYIATIVLALTITLSGFSQDVEATKPNVVPGLKLPDPMKVSYDEGFITVKADCEGQVEWIVLLTANETGKAKIKYKIGSDPNSLDVSIPPEPCQITVFCYGIVDNKLTRAARCEIVVEGGKVGPKPIDDDSQPSPVSGSAFIVTVIHDPQNLPLDYSLIAKWPDSAKKLIAAGHTPYLKSSKDPKIKAWLTDASKRKPQFGDAIKKAGPIFIVIQDSSGVALAAIPAPKTTDELLKILQGGK